MASNERKGANRKKVRKLYPPPTIYVAKRQWFNPKRKDHQCKYCVWPGYWDRECETPHYRCLTQQVGRCVVPRAHRHYGNDLPSTCPYRGDHKYKDEHIDGELKDAGDILYDNQMTD